MNPKQGLELSGAIKPATAPETTGTAAAPKIVKCYVLRYVYVEDVLERRVPHRAAHIALTKSYADRGQLLLGGALDPPDAAYILFKVDSRAEVEAFVKADPYVKNGIVVSHEIRDWNVVVGAAL
mmetsp:Transcript_105295/g.293221  ORF Transcript_105295/g.293221 Transcript_105295/m.293221 type:complete len:124 (+) Transcript_105295:3-374(+)